MIAPRFSRDVPASTLSFSSCDMHRRIKLAWSTYFLTTTCDVKPSPTVELRNAETITSVFIVFKRGHSASARANHDRGRDQAFGWPPECRTGTAFSQKNVPNPLDTLQFIRTLSGIGARKPLGGQRVSIKMVGGGCGRVAGVGGASRSPQRKREPMPTAHGSAVEPINHAGFAGGCACWLRPQPPGPGRVDRASIYILRRFAPS